MEVIGRVESGTENESNAGAVAEDVRSLRTPVLSRHFRHPWRSYVAAAWTSVPPCGVCRSAAMNMDVIYHRVRTHGGSYLNGYQVTVWVMHGSQRFLNRNERTITRY
ncbi:MAG: hypothetical protein V3V73_00455 [Gammaproteobacteria bacterium]